MRKQNEKGMIILLKQWEIQSGFSLNTIM
jgi:hypothetical protein